MSSEHDLTTDVMPVLESLPGAGAVVSVQLLTALLVIITNVINLIIFSRFKNIKIHHYYIIALAVADLSTCIIVLTGATYLLDSTTQYIPRLDCKKYGLIFMLPLEITVLLHCLMSIDKCRSIMNPIDYRLFTISHKKAQLFTVLQIVAAFLIPAILNTIYTVTGIIEPYYEQLLGSCYITWDFASTAAFAVFSFWPLVIQMVTHGMIIRKVVKLNKHNRKRLIRASRTVFTTVLSFYICWLPYGIYIIWQSTSNNGKAPLINEYQHQKVFYVTSFLATLHSCLSLPIYYTTMGEFRLIFSKIFGNNNWIANGKEPTTKLTSSNPVKISYLT